LGLPFQGSLASSLIRISPDILSHASSPHGRDHTCGGVSEYQSALALFPLAVAGGTTLMGFCASTIPIFDFIQARATVFASRRLVHYCHSPTIFGPNAEICRSYRDVLRRGTRARLRSSSARDRQLPAQTRTRETRDPRGSATVPVTLPSRAGFERRVRLPGCPGWLGYPPSTEGALRARHFPSTSAIRPAREHHHVSLEPGLTSPAGRTQLALGWEQAPDGVGAPSTRSTVLS
jgi:hypothetical protein